MVGMVGAGMQDSSRTKMVWAVEYHIRFKCSGLDEKSPRRTCVQTIQYVHSSSYSTCTCTVLSTNDSSNWDVIKHRGRIPVRVQIVVCLLPAPIPCCPKLVQECEYVSRIRSKSRIKFRNWDVSYFHFLPGLRFVFLEYLVERLI